MLSSGLLFLHPLILLSPLLIDCQSASSLLRFKHGDDDGLIQRRFATGDLCAPCGAAMRRADDGHIALLLAAEGI